MIEPWKYPAIFFGVPGIGAVLAALVVSGEEPVIPVILAAVAMASLLVFSPHRQ